MPAGMAGAWKLGLRFQIQGPGELLVILAPTGQGHTMHHTKQVAEEGCEPLGVERAMDIKVEHKVKTTQEAT